MKHLGLFEGIGGFSLAARWMGWDTVAWCEWDKFCQTILKYYFPNANAHGDITKTDFTRYAGQVDILTGGFPCQPYSAAGKRLGKEDDRHLWPEMLRAIREIKPRWVVGENVRGLTNWGGRLVFDEVQTDLENEGYEVTSYLLPACAVNAPHRRDRIWIIAHRNESTTGSPGEGRGIKGDRGKDDSKQELRGKQAKQHNGCGELLRHDTNANEKGLQRNKLNRTSNEGWEQPSIPTTQLCKISDWNGFPTQSPICSRNDGISDRLDGITFSKWREKSIGAFGNAIVPQVAYKIFQAINEYHFNDNKINKV